MARSPESEGLRCSPYARGAEILVLEVELTQEDETYVRDANLPQVLSGDTQLPSHCTQVITLLQSCCPMGTCRHMHTYVHA